MTLFYFFLQIFSLTTQIEKNQLNSISFERLQTHTNYSSVCVY